MKRLEKTIQEVASLLPTEAESVRYMCEWYRDGDSRSTWRCLTQSGSGVPHSRSGSDLKEAMRALRSLIDEQRESWLGSRDNNVVSLLIKKDGTSELKFGADTELDARREKEIRASIGDELYEKYERERREKAALLGNQKEQPAGPPSPAPAVELTIPQLLGVLYDEVTGAAPANWHTVEVEGQVWTEDGKQAVKVHCYYSLPGSPDRHPLKLAQNLPAMNAVLRLNRVMAAQGDVWTTIHLKFTANDPNTMVDWR